MVDELYGEQIVGFHMPVLAEQKSYGVGNATQHLDAINQLTGVEQGALYYQPKQGTITGTIPQNDDTCVLLDPHKIIGNLMTPVEPPSWGTYLTKLAGITNSYNSTYQL